jgi:hypothetical protein
MSTDSWHNFIDNLKLMVLACGSRAMYEACHDDVCHDKLTNVPDVGINETKTDLPPQFRRLAKKSVERYARAQEKKWRNWVKSMSR